MVVSVADVFARLGTYFMLGTYLFFCTETCIICSQDMDNLCQLRKYLAKSYNLFALYFRLVWMKKAKAGFTVTTLWVALKN